MDINAQIDKVLLSHLGLKYNYGNDFFEGTLILPDADSYEVKIEIHSYPKLFPIVYETAGRIPKKVDRHVYTDSGSCCFTTRAQSQILLKTKIRSLLDFIDEILIKYLENNSFYEINKHYYGEEYSHGKKGILEGYKDILKIDNVLKIARAMMQAAYHNSLKIHQNCYCGSGRRLRKCHDGRHINHMRLLFLVEKLVLREDLINFKEEIDKSLHKKNQKLSIMPKNDQNIHFG